MAENPLDRLRAICLALPEVTERLNHGQPSFVVRGRRTVVQYLDGTDRFGVVGMWCPAPPGVREDLVEAEPDRFYRPELGGSEWVGVRLEVDPDWAEITAIVEDAYRVVAPKGLVAALDAAGS